MKTMLRQWLLVLAVACAGPMAAAVAQDAKPARTMPDAVKNALASVVGIKATVPRAARSAETLGVERIGHGVAIDADGLVLTVGYLILEADAVEVTEAGGRKISAAVVAYDYDSGFGLVRTAIPLRARPLPLGESDALKVETQATVAGYGGPDAAQRVIVADRRDFAGYWEYVLDRAIFTAPPYPLWGGAALIGDDGALLGIGSL